jgi:hypothetical protein
MLVHRAKVDTQSRTAFTKSSSATRGHDPGPRSAANDQAVRQRESSMIILGIILIIVGLVAKISILTTIGVILLIVGVVLSLLGATGRAVGGRKTYY